MGDVIWLAVDLKDDSKVGEMHYLVEKGVPAALAPGTPQEFMALGPQELWCARKRFLRPKPQEFLRHSWDRGRRNALLHQVVTFLCQDGRAALHPFTMVEAAGVTPDRRR